MPESGYTSEQRKRKRTRLIYHFRAFDEASGDALGYIGDVSEKGFLVVHERDIALNTNFSLSIEVPLDDGDRGRVSVQAVSVWSRQDRNPEFKNTGFAFVEPSEQAIAGIQAMIEELGREDES